MKRTLGWLTALVLAAALLLIGFLGGRRYAQQDDTSAHAPQAGAKKVLYWYDTMLPQQHFDHPGLSPMGMQMVPRYADQEADAKGVVHIDPATVQNLGVRTATVERRALGSQIAVPATVGWDLRRTVTVSARVDAVIARLDVRAPYTAVAAGAPLAELLAPQWSSALAEYHALQQAQSTDAQALRAAARARLRVLGLSSADVRADRGAGAAITLHAPQAGVVTTLDVREGQRVSAGQTLMTLSDLSTVWIEAALPQAVAGRVRSGANVEVTVAGLPGSPFHGTVDTVLPEIDSATRTQRARIVVDNPDHALSPGMFATVRLMPASGEARPVVPDDALIATGARSRVILAEGDGRFRAVPVRIGQAAGGYTEILSGLHGGEQVVVSGQFLIDSEASLSGALERLDDTQRMPASAASASMPGMAMPERHP